MVKFDPVPRTAWMRSARAGMIAFGVPALAKPLIATVSCGWMNSTASAAEVTLFRKTELRIRVEPEVGVDCDPDSSTCVTVTRLTLDTPVNCPPHPHEMLLTWTFSP